MKDNLLMIFYRNPALGKVKTRLAATLGEEKALAVYIHLAAHTREVAKLATCDRWIFYSDYVDTEDAWENSFFKKKLQQGDDLGAKMKNAFTLGFEAGYKRICIIGTDCLELNASIVNEAFQQAHEHDVVIGPAQDGGYYLLGMKRIHSDFFTAKKWSTPSVFQDTLSDIQALGLSSAILQTLRDVDEASDLPPGYLIW